MSNAVFHHYPNIYKLFYFTFILSCITGVPVPVSNFYNKFIETLLNDNCKMPDEVKLPFNLSSHSEPFGYLSAPLNECQNPEASLDDTESHLLCREVFEVLRNITCLEYKSSLPEIKSTLSLNNVCSEFNAMKDVFPQGEYVAPRLVDGITCKLLCSDKFESLCQTLVWSYDVQTQINVALVNNAQNEKDTKEISSNDDLETAEHKDKNEVSNKGLAAEKGNANTQKKEPTHEEPNNANDLVQSEVEVKENPSISESDLEHTVTVSPNSNSLISISQTPSNNNTQNQNPGEFGKNLKNTAETIKPSVKTKGTDTGKQSIDNINEITVTPVNQNTYLKSKIINVNLKNKTKDIIQPGKEHPTDTTNNQIFNDLNFSSSLGKDNQNKEALGSISSDIKGNKDSESITNNIQGSMKSANPIPSNNTPDNKINNQEQEYEVKGTESEATFKNTDEDDTSNTGKILDNTKEASSGIPSMISSETDSKLELTTPQILFEETFDAGIPPDSEDPDLYPDDPNELSNDDEFSETVHDKTLSKPSQEKVPKDESSVPGEIQVGTPNDGTSNLDPFMNSRNHAHGDIPMMGSFPEQEDSHFFFYFLSIVVILMAGYLLFHNKQKIIALIVEGRHERSRRRSHGAGYKKLETK